MKTATGHEVGKTYLSWYWHERYTVLGVESVCSLEDSVRVLWADGSTTIHGTPRDRDQEITPEKGGETHY